MKTNKDSTLTTKLRQICKKFKITDSEINDYGKKPKIYDRFPYAPYIPKNWNRILVLAESQQLRGNNEGNSEYVKCLMNADVEDLIFRLGNEKITGVNSNVQLGISPWDEGLIKIAMLSCFPEYRSDQFGVSNAVPWHLDKNKEKQTDFLERKSIKFWKKILPELNPKIIICTGKYAESIISETKFCEQNDCKQIEIRSASQLERIVSLFNEDDLLDRYPEVKIAIEQNPDLIGDYDKRYYVFYAALAVSNINSILKKHKNL